MNAPLLQNTPLRLRTQSMFRHGFFHQVIQVIQRMLLTQTLPLLHLPHRLTTEQKQKQLQRSQFHLLQQLLLLEKMTATYRPSFRQQNLLLPTRQIPSLQQVPLPQSKPHQRQAPVQLPHLLQQQRLPPSKTPPRFLRTTFFLLHRNRMPAANMQTRFPTSMHSLTRQSPALTKGSTCRDRRLKQSQKCATSRARSTRTSHW